MKGGSENKLISTGNLELDKKISDGIPTFFTNCKSLVDDGKTILITLNTYSYEEETLVRIQSTCDAHLKMKKAMIGDNYVMVMETVKVRGAQRTSGNVVSVEVHPGYGMMVPPMRFTQV